MKANQADAPRCENCKCRCHGIFRDLPLELLQQLSNARIYNTYKAHQVIFYEGNQPFGIFGICSGRVKIYKSDALGHQQIIRIVGAGDLIGYRCILANEPYTATAETLSDVEACFIDKKNFFKFIEQAPQTAFNIMQSLATDLRSAEEKHIKLVHKNVRERFAELLLNFSIQYGKKCPQGIELGIQLSRDEMAGIIGSSSESVIRMMSEFKHERMIDVHRRKIILLNLPLLKKACENKA